MVVHIYFKRTSMERDREIHAHVSRVTLFSDLFPECLVLNTVGSLDFERFNINEIEWFFIEND